MPSVSQDSAIVDCVFCRPPADRLITRNALAFSLWDGYPVTPNHALVIPTRHIPDYFALTRDELIACDSLLHELRARICSLDPTVDGFNIGLNIGAVAGQSIFHCHYHLIPRRKCDVENPRGGVRHLFPGKGSY